jgi:hypothetical protein
LVGSSFVGRVVPVNRLRQIEKYDWLSPSYDEKKELDLLGRQTGGGDVTVVSG